MYELSVRFYNQSGIQYVYFCMIRSFNSLTISCIISSGEELTDENENDEKQTNDEVIKSFLIRRKGSHLRKNRRRMSIAKNWSVVENLMDFATRNELFYVKNPLFSLILARFWCH